MSKKSDCMLAKAFCMRLQQLRILHTNICRIAITELNALRYATACYRTSAAVLDAIIVREHDGVWFQVLPHCCMQ